MCNLCKDTGVIETGNNDLPCSCEKGNTALFNVAGIEGLVKGELLKKQLPYRELKRMVAANA